MGKGILVLFLGFVSGLWAFGQELSIDIGSKQASTTWISASQPNEIPQGSIENSESKFSLTPSASSKDAKVFVYLPDTNEIAVKRAAEVGKGWAVSAADFKYVGKVRIRVEHKGDPVQTAVVELGKPADGRSGIIDANAKGETEFFGVAFGQVDVTVRYRNEKGAEQDIKQSFQLEKERSSPIPTFVVSLNDTVPTISGAETTTATGSTPASQGGKAPTADPPKNDTTNPIGAFLAYLLAFALAAILVWFGLQWMKKTQATVQAKLEQMGVEIPTPNDGGAVPVAATQPPPPVQKIDLGSDALPDAPIASATAVSVAIGIPTLIASTGQRFELREGENVVSRESGEIVFAGDSTVSRRHAVVVRSGNTVTVRDEGSTNGTFVNGQRIASETTLLPHDQVQFGAVQLRFES